MASDDIVRDTQPTLGVPSIRRRFRDERLRVADLPPVPRTLAGLALGGLALVALVVLSVALGRPVPGGEVGIAGRFLGQPSAVAWPRLPVVLAIVGSGIATACLVFAAARPGWRLPRLTLAAGGLLGAAFGAGLLSAVPILRITHAIVGTALPVPEVVSGIGVVVMVLSAGLVLIRSPWCGRGRVRPRRSYSALSS